MARPVTISIHGQQWSIRRRQLKGHWGRTDFPERIIYLDPSLVGEQLVNIALHEVAHAVDCETEETRVEVLAAAQTQALATLGLIPRSDDGTDES